MSFSSFAETDPGSGIFTLNSDNTIKAVNPATLSTLNTFSNSALKNNVTVRPHPTSETGVTALSGFYIGENIQGTGNSQYGYSTYAMVATTVTVLLISRVMYT